MNRIYNDLNSILVMVDDLKRDFDLTEPSRRSPISAVLRWDHPDVVTFINAKQDLSRWQNYNISISVTDEYMAAVTNVNPKLHKVSHPKWGSGFLYQCHKTGKVKAFQEDPGLSNGWRAWTVRDTWNLICKRAHATGEHGDSIREVEEEND